MDPSTLADNAIRVAAEAAAVAEKAAGLAQEATQVALAQTANAGDPFVFLVTVFVLTCFIGYYVVWSVTPALHSPLMAVTNAISSVIIVGALIAAGPGDWNLSKIFGFIAVILASVNIFGGFIVTQRMLAMYRAKK